MEATLNRPSLKLLDPADILSRYYATEQKKSLSKKSNMTKSKVKQSSVMDFSAESSLNHDIVHSNTLPESGPATTSGANAEIIAASEDVQLKGTKLEMSSKAPPISTPADGALLVNQKSVYQTEKGFHPFQAFQDFDSDTVHSMLQ